PPDSSLVKSRKAAPGDPVPWSWAAKFCKQWRQAQEDLGNLVVSHDAYDSTFGTALAIARHEIAGPIFVRGRNEVTLVTMDEQLGIPVRCRLDHVPEGPFLVDVKVTHDVTERGFIRNAYDSGYHLQAALYLDVWNTLCGDTDLKEGFKFVTVESRRPWAVNVFDATPEFLDRGRRDYLNALATFARCQRDNHWPAYPPIEIPLCLPAFAR
ncbi:MAG: PD-(D/E)XK nuclease-like domain-containing protein, partial [Verrucomicrobiota bacterium]